MNRKRLSARDWVNRKTFGRDTPAPDDLIVARASDYIQPFGSLTADGLAYDVVIYARVSSRTQHRSQNLDEMESYLYDAATKAGATVLAIFRETASGWMLDPDERSELIRAAELASEHGAVLLTYSPDRFVRNVMYHSVKRPGAQPTQGEFNRLREMTKGVPLATLIDPDTDWRDVRSARTKLGQQSKGRTGGRPKAKRPGHKKSRREELMPWISKLWKFGLSLGEMSECVNVPRSTIQDWVTMLRKDVRFFDNDNGGA